MTAQIVKTMVKQCASLVAFRAGLTSPRRFGGGIAILMYHSISPLRDVMGLSISPDFFEKQLQYLKSRFELISMAQAASLLGAGPVSGQYAVLTFDDGFRDNYDHAFPLLRRYGVPATIFVAVDGVEKGDFSWYSFDDAILRSEANALDLEEFGLGRVPIGTAAEKEHAIRFLHRELKLRDHALMQTVSARVKAAAPTREGSRIMISWDEAKQMQDSGLVTIGSHTMTHPILTRVTAEKAKWEVGCSKAVIEERLGGRVDFFAYPNGSAADFDQGVVDAVREAGYRAACTTIPRAVRGEDDPFRLPRIDVTYGMCEGVRGGFSPEMFETALVIRYL